MAEGVFVFVMGYRMEFLYFHLNYHSDITSATRLLYHTEKNVKM